MRARLRPDEADELLKAHHARTVLNRPPPVADKDRAALVESAGLEVFEGAVREEAARAGSHCWPNGCPLASTRRSAATRTNSAPSTSPVGPCSGGRTS